MIIRPLPLDMPEKEHRRHRLQYDKVKKLIQSLDDKQQKVLKSDGRLSKSGSVSFYDFLLRLDLSW
jgi:hypothetical protein